MKTIPLILLVVLFYNFGSIHKDRIESPETVQFTLTDNKQLTAKNEELVKYDADILSGKLKIAGATLFFKTGGKMALIYKNGRWTSISFQYKDKKLDVPENTLGRIPEIHFSSITLVLA